MKKRIVEVAAVLCAAAVLVCTVIFSGNKKETLVEEQTKSPTSSSLPEDESELRSPLHDLDAVEAVQLLEDFPDVELWEEFGAVLRGEKEFFDGCSEKWLTIDRIAEAVTDLEELWPWLSAERFSMVDLDHDGVPELIIEVWREYSDLNSRSPDNYVILRWQDDKVYSYNRWLRAFRNLKVDGSFRGSGGASTAYYYSSITFTEDSCIGNMIGYYSGYYDMDNDKNCTRYYLDDEEVTYYEFEKGISSHNRSCSAAWYKITPERIASLFGS